MHYLHAPARAPLQLPERAEVDFKANLSGRPSLTLRIPRVPEGPKGYLGIHKLHKRVPRDPWEIPRNDRDPRDPSVES